MRPEIIRAAVAVPRQQGLDLVRAAAIASVMLYHAKTMMLVPSPAPWLSSFGWMGVDLLFVLTGCLIAGQLVKPGTVLPALIIAGIFLRAFLWFALVAEKPFDVHSGSNWRAYVSLIYYPTWSRLDGLLAGIALATLKTFRPAVWKGFVAQPNLLLAAGLAGSGIAITVFGGPVSPLVGVAI